ncbi:holo-ACP synthase AcpS [Corynebacterium ureicelerivorans]|uniref:holo-ACP synthase AcpS n=1 Tax=uncultured Corynebacterium sp. TaxID=159447 RepID=UPI00259B867D|nr:holo-ACP synthase [uncultured Corynebacterium sp.]
MHIGIDVVSISTFAQQIELPGSTFESVFTDREIRTCNTKPNRAASFAGRWAVKEAYVKAWSQTIIGQPPLIAPDELNFAEIEVVDDAFGRPVVQLHGEVARLGPRVHSVSLSHDGDYAVANVIVE